MKAYSNPKGV